MLCEEWLGRTRVDEAGTSVTGAENVVVDELKHLRLLHPLDQRNRESHLVAAIENLVRKDVADGQLECMLADAGAELDARGHTAEKIYESRVEKRHSR